MILQDNPYPFVLSDAGRKDSKRSKQQNDCTVRAVTLAFDIPYDRAYDMLKSAGRKCSQGFHFNEWAEESVVNGKRLKWKPFPAVKGQKRMNPVKFTNEYKTGRFIVRTTYHVFAIIDGVGYDDTQEGPGRCIYGCWEVVNA